MNILRNIWRAIAALWCWIVNQAVELIALALALALFFWSPYLIRLASPQSGAWYDLGFLQRPVLAIVQLLLFTVAAWKVLEIYFRTIDRHADTGGFAADWKLISAFQRVVITIAVFVLFVAAFLISLSLTPI